MQNMLTAWKQEFFIVGAWTYAHLDVCRQITYLKRIYQGALPENLKKYQLKLKQGRLSYKGSYFKYDMYTNPFCLTYLAKNNSCEGCPLRFSCLSAYHLFIQNNDPMPMINLLDKVYSERRKKWIPSK